MLFRSCGALDATEQFIADREKECQTALAALARELDLSSNGVALLQSAVVALLHRSS